MKKVRRLLIVLIAGCVITACGRGDEKTEAEASAWENEKTEPESGGQETAEQSAAPEENAGSYQTGSVVRLEPAAGTEQAGQAAGAEQAGQVAGAEQMEQADEPAPAVADGTESPQAAGGYEDNFSVPAEDAAAFAAKIQAAVMGQDIEALADLAAYPLYIGLEKGGISVSTGEALLKLGAETIFTPELSEAVANVDEASLTPSKAGFVLSKDGRPNIVFGVVDGELAIRGINY